MPQRDQLILTTLLEIKQEKLNQAEIALKRRREELAAEFAKLTKAEEKLEAEALARQIAIDKLSEEISKISTAAKIDARRKHIQNVADPAYLIANDNLEKQKNLHWTLADHQRCRSRARHQAS